MPIVYVHGVAVRDQSSFAPIQALLQQYVAPAMVTNPADADKVRILPAYWGRDGAMFAWNGESLPQVVQAQSLGRDTSFLAVANAIASDKVIAATAAESFRAQSLPSTNSTEGVSANDLTGLLTNLVVRDFATGGNVTGNVVLSPEAVKSIIALRAAVKAEIPTSSKVDLTPALLDRVSERADDIFPTLSSGNTLVAQSLAGNIISSVTGTAKSIIGDAQDAAALALTKVLLNYRAPINQGITLFFGDVFTYLTNRGDASSPGLIVSDVLTVIRDAAEGAKTSASEPLIVLSHSMGGQIVYDCITYFLPNIAQYRDIRVDFWTACASQVGLFEEMKLFKVSSNKYSLANANKVPFPSKDQLGYWYNVWDPDDFLSYTAAPIFEGVDDEEFDSGLSIINAHGGYLASPVFYEQFAAKVKEMMTVGGLAR